MDRNAIVEDTVLLWDQINDAYVAKYGKPPAAAVHSILFERAHTFIIHKNISEERSQPRQQAPEQEVEPATQKQLDYIRDLLESKGRSLTEGENIRTKQQASEFIQKLKEG